MDRIKDHIMTSAELEERFGPMFKMIPEEKRRLFDLVSTLCGWAGVRASGETATAIVFNQGAVAWRFIQTYKVIKDWIGNYEAGTDVCSRIDEISNWYRRNGWLHLDKCARETLADMNSVHMKCVTLSQSISERAKEDKK